MSVSWYWPPFNRLKLDPQDKILKQGISSYDNEFKYSAYKYRYVFYYHAVIKLLSLPDVKQNINS